MATAPQDRPIAVVVHSGDGRGPVIRLIALSPTDIYGIVAGTDLSAISRKAIIGLFEIAQLLVGGTGLAVVLKPRQRISH